ncbi:MAG: DUF547 domain-containing protein [Phycisphaerales bacterium]|nr:MAG: DUF547 domain-containing protein [Phycisphaerales bacterium]
MSKPFAAICLALGPFLALAGCGSAEPESPPARTSISEPTQPVIGEQAQERACPEPEASLPETHITTPEATSGPPSQIAPEGDTTGTEPNTTPPPDPASEGESAGIEPLQEVPGAEPNEAEASEPAPPRPETPATAELPPQQERTDEEKPDALTSFYQEYAELLAEHVLEDGRVDYQALRRKRLRLKHLLSEPDELDPNLYQAWSEEDKLAFWINTYNLKMLEIIARNYPIQSSWWLRLTWPPSDIRHIGGIWSDYRFIVMDEEFTLGEVERRFFRKTFGDPRAYLAIAYAARSGPTLRRSPYRGEQLDQQLDDQVRAFLASDKGFRIDREKAVVYLSALFEPSWRGKDFVGRYATNKKFKSHSPETRAVLNFLTRYLPREEVYYLEVENYTLAYMNFDWRLNDRGRGY